jgi:hypothetical protein
MKNTLHRATLWLFVGCLPWLLFSPTGTRAATVPLDLPKLEEPRQPPKPRVRPRPQPKPEKPATARFSKAANGVITDTHTGLQWYEGPDREITWDEAKIWVESLGVDGGGWRLPTLKELAGLYQKDRRSGVDFFIAPEFTTIGRSINAGSGHSLGGWWVWSNEKKDLECFWNYDFINGAAHWNHHLDHFFIRALAMRSDKGN